MVSCVGVFFCFFLPPSLCLPLSPPSQLQTQDTNFNSIWCCCCEEEEEEEEALKNLLALVTQCLREKKGFGPLKVKFFSVESWGTVQLCFVYVYLVFFLPSLGLFLF